MDIKEQVIKELAYFYLEADSNTTFGERADTINKFADKIVKLFNIHDVVVLSGRGVCSCELYTSEFELDTGEILCCKCELPKAN